MKIQDIMTKDPAWVTPGTTIRDAAKLMQREDTGIIPVVESGETKKLVGVVTDRDIAIRVVAEGRDGEARVSDVMTSSRLATLRPDADVDDVMDMMADQQVRRVPIVDDRGTLVGIVAQADIVRKARDDSKAERTVEKISEPSRRHSQ
ncbi:MAG: CBS domain-containing protein [Gemmatimonadota bacterium]|nr:CBS domain-containing protein [Gemmatimonadota bacterium]